MTTVTTTINTNATPSPALQRLAQHVIDVQSQHHLLTHISTYLQDITYQCFNHCVVDQPASSPFNVNTDVSTLTGSPLHTLGTAYTSDQQVCLASCASERLSAYEITLQLMKQYKPNNMVLRSTIDDAVQ